MKTVLPQTIPGVQFSAHFLNASAAGTIEAMAGYLLQQKSELAPSDLLMVFGNPHIAAPAAKEAARLYHDGLAPLILVSGGKKAASGHAEAHEIYLNLRGEGIPDSALLVEMSSLNTQENVVFSRSLLHKASPETNESSMICIGHAIAGRRFPMTVAANWPEITLPMFSHVWCNAQSEVDWHTRPDLRGEVLAQFVRIEPYIKAGFIKEIDVAAINEIALSRKTPPCPV